MKYYIAGPIFNEEQLKLVKKIEDTIKKSGGQYYSPRENGMYIKDADVTRVSGQVIVDSNIEGITDCDKMIAILTKDEKGKYDSGTLFEIGVFAASRLLTDTDYDRFSDHYLSQFIIPVGADSQEELTKIYDAVRQVMNFYVEYITNDDNSVVGSDLCVVSDLTPADMVEKLNKIEEVEVVNIDKDKLPADKFINTMVFIDERPIRSMILLGAVSEINRNISTPVKFSTATFPGASLSIMSHYSVADHYEITVEDDGNLTAQAVSDVKSENIK